MPLTGLEIYKLLPQTNCKDCGYPTCLAFAMKLAAKQAQLKDCPHVTEEAAGKLAAASAPPIRLVELSGGNGKLQVGNETVLFRHEKTFYHKPGLFLRLKASDGADKIKAQVAEASAYQVDYVGITLELDGFAIELRRRRCGSLCRGGLGGAIGHSKAVDPPFPGPGRRQARVSKLPKASARCCTPPMPTTPRRWRPWPRNTRFRWWPRRDPSRVWPSSRNRCCRLGWRISSSTPASTAFTKGWNDSQPSAAWPSKPISVRLVTR